MGGAEGGSGAVAQVGDIGLADIQCESKSRPLAAIPKIFQAGFPVMIGIWAAGVTRLGNGLKKSAQMKRNAPPVSLPITDAPTIEAHAVPTASGRPGHCATCIRLVHRCH